MRKPPNKLSVYKRLVEENRWSEAAPIRDELMQKAKENGMFGEEAMQWAYAELDKRFPPIAAVNQSDPNTLEDDIEQNEGTDEKRAANRLEGQPSWKRERGPGEVAVVSLSGDTMSQGSSSPRSRAKDAEFSVSGLGEIPGNWPDLPPNAPLSAEVSWVQANRLRCVRETSDGVVVDLSRALCPAPSYAALGWLETSIKTYAKFVDVAAKATASNDGEQAEIRREQQSIEEVRRLLAEMLEG